jgi:hypothetical protein
MIKRITGLYKEAYAGLPRGAWILALADFINRCGFMVLVFLNLYLTQRLGFTLLQARSWAPTGWARWRAATWAVI